MPRLASGAAHPNPPLRPSALAERLGVPRDAVRAWLDDGLPTLADGRIDPFAAVNWLSWGRLDRCPALARRWRRYLAFFAPFVAGEAAPRRRTWRRRHRLYLPVVPERVAWWLPAVADDERQHRLDETPPVCGAVTADAADGGWRLTLDAPEAVPLAESAATVERLPHRGLAEGDDEHRRLLAEVEAVAAGFTYVYRHHAAGEGQHIGGESSRRLLGERGPKAERSGGEAPVQPLPDPSEAGRVDARGSCLDCARLLGQRLGERGRPWRMIAGIIADDELANPHFWLEVETTAGWQPLDPSLPAIARMLGADWRAFARAYTGGCDARRIALAPLAPHDLPEGGSIGSLIGEAVATIAGVRHDAWACLDWVGGDCDAEFVASEV